MMSSTLVPTACAAAAAASALATFWRPSSGNQTSASSPSGKCMRNSAPFAKKCGSPTTRQSALGEKPNVTANSQRERATQSLRN
jgi:hypothetical protein